MFFTAALTQESIQYLKELTQSAPLELFQAPVVYVTAPSEGVNVQDPQARAILDSIVYFKFADARILFNPATQRSELDVFLSVDLGMTAKPPREALFPMIKPSPTFMPYFSWCIEPNRSRTTRAFVISLINSLQADQGRFQFSATVSKQTDTAPLGLVFNESTLHASATNSSDLYREGSRLW